MLAPSVDHRSNGVSQSHTSQVNSKVANLLRNQTYSHVPLSRISQAQDSETWSNLILGALLGNLAHVGSQYGQFGTPDTDIKNTVVESGSGKNLWVKLLGIKMKVIIIQLDSSGLSETQKNRIRQLDHEFRNIFPSRLPQEIHPYATIN